MAQAIGSTQALYIASIFPDDLPVADTQHSTTLGNRNPSKYLVTSPYTSIDHQLDLSHLQQPTKLMALALQMLRPIRDDFAVVPYEAAFNWAQMMDRLRDMVALRAGHRWTRQVFYVVEFRSRLKDDADKELLFALDRMSHAEANRSGGLLKYWFGKPDSQGKNMATCVWRSKEDAVAGGQGAWHQRARACIPEMYDRISVVGKRLVVDDDVSSWWID